jgi:hypothetical protein
MTRPKKANGKRGRRRGGQGDDGSGRARGWARGGGRGIPRSASYLMDQALDFNIQMVADGVLAPNLIFFSLVIIYFSSST